MKNNTVIHFALNKELKTKIERLAKQNGLSVSAYIKMVFTNMKEE